MPQYGFLITLKNKDDEILTLKLRDKNAQCHFRKTANFGSNELSELGFFELTLSWNTFQASMLDNTVISSVYSFFRDALVNKPITLTVAYYGVADLVNTETNEIIEHVVSDEDLFQESNFLVNFVENKIVTGVDYVITPFNENITEMCNIRIKEESEE